MSDISVNQRAQQILKILVERYIQEGSPIGSKTIAEEYPLGLSSASIRHILSDLETAGLLTSPHTSAGRVPTELGYRLFVNNLLTIKPLDEVVLEDIKSNLNPDLNTTSLIQSASSLLSSLTSLIGVVALPRHNKLELRHVEFLALSGNRVLVIFVLNNREVQNRVISSDKVYTQSELQRAANYLNAHYSGKDLLTVRAELLQAMQTDQNNLQTLLQAVMEMATKVFNPENAKKDCAIAGQGNLLNYTNDSNIEQLRALFNAFTEKQEILHLLDQSLDAEGIQIFIGKESGYKAFDDCSIVTTSYSLNGQLIGSLGVIGPTRMPYDRVISAVDITAKLLSAALNQG